MKGFPRFIIEIWCMDQTYFDNLTKDSIGSNYLLVCQGLLDRTVEAKGMRIKDSKEMVRAFSTMFTELNLSTKLGLTWEQILLESLQNQAKLTSYKFTLH